MLGNIFGVFFRNCSVASQYGGVVLLTRGTTLVLSLPPYYEPNAEVSRETPVIFEDK
jgi:hypothetical protein